MKASAFFGYFLVLTILVCGWHTEAHASITGQRKGVSMSASAGKQASLAGDLCWAAADGDIDRVKSLIRDGVDINTKNEAGDTPLHKAASHGRNDVVELLIAKGADVNARGQNGYTPLHEALSGDPEWAAFEIIEAKLPDLDSAEDRHSKLVKQLTKKRQIDMVKLLIAHGADVNAKHDFGGTPLGEAAIAASKRTFDPEIVRILIRKGADAGPAATALGLTSVDAAKLLIANGADVNAKDESDLAPLHRAASSGYKRLAELLLNSGANIHVTDRSNRSPLHRAAFFGQKRMVRLLLAKGADIGAKDKHGNTPLYEAARGMHAASGMHEETVKFLIRKGANTNETIKFVFKTGSTPLHEAAERDEIQQIKKLIARGAGIEALDKHGRTPLFCSVIGGHKDALELLAAHGANIDAEDDGGFTPLHEAVSKGHKEIAEFLISKGADVNAKDAFGFTLLSDAVHDGNRDLVELLISSGADVNVRSAFISTPLKTACRLGHREIVKLLLKHGAKD